MNSDQPTVPLGVCVLEEAAPNRARTVSYPNYIFEILAHAGVFHTRFPPDQFQSVLPQLRILITVGEMDLPDAVRKQLSDWIEAGGAWLSLSGLCGMEAVLGVERMKNTYANWGGGVRSLGEGYLSPVEADHPTLAHLNRPLHYFGGAAVQAQGATPLAMALDAHGRETAQPVLLERSVGKGRCILIAPDLTGTIVTIQQGRGAVTRDGVPSPDGTSPVNDGVLKSDDGAALDWIFDREPVPGTEGLQIFIQPIADLWRELLLRGIFHLASLTQTALPVLWYWPEKLPAIGHLSHDTDGNDPKLAQRLLDCLAAGEVTSTWCVILPGYEASLMRRIRSAGHEFATHYDSMTKGLPWSADQFDRQFAELKSLFEGEQPVTNKNHYLRWEGDTDLWDWCLKHGIQLDQSKGASKTGEAGFNFGTCHPYFPVRFDGSAINVLELPTPTQDLCVFAPESIFEPLLAQAIKNHGVLHLLFHPAHFHRDDVANSIANAIARGKQQGLQWWTGRQINTWERARRAVRLNAMDSRSITVQSDSPLKNATVLRLAPSSAAGDFEAWGFRFSAQIISLSGATRIEL
jgi:hypothetical protein